ncbi:hypothetical protein ASF77_13495 [Massilia sp. Leaf139]|nr:hypothetical protein ASF77_13495 [Massilia sp. Leaf139]
MESCAGLGQILRLSGRTAGTATSETEYLVFEIGANLAASAGSHRTHRAIRRVDSRVHGGCQLHAET